MDFGLPSNRPLIGDVDATAAPDARVRRRDLLACDTAHAGGAPGFTERSATHGTGASPYSATSTATAAPLCLFQDGVFSCDLRHHGGAPTS